MVMHSTVALAATSLAMLCIGLGAWMYLLRRWPDTGAVSGAVSWHAR
jgi:DHA1 family bicyclomycin/chloramphenicol resistance-like MFS transporter